MKHKKVLLQQSLELAVGKLCLSWVSHSDGGPIGCTVSLSLNRFPARPAALSKLFITLGETQVCDVMAGSLLNDLEGAGWI